MASVSRKSRAGWGCGKPRVAEWGRTQSLGFPAQFRVAATPRKLQAASRGAFLIEALVALVVFSMAAAGLFALAANALRAGTEALARAEANDIAASALARMAAESLATLAERYDAALPGPGYRSLAAMASRLPGVRDEANAPVVSIAPGPSVGSRSVSVTVYWQLPGESAPHRAAMTSVLAP
jgi:type IV pilus assembly protein PilV